MKPLTLGNDYDKSVRTQITLTASLKRRIEQAAKPKGESLSEFLRQAALNQLKREQKRSQELTALAERVVGSLKLTKHPQWSTMKKIIQWQKELRKEWD